MPTKPRSVYWDSCVYLSFLQKTPSRYPVLQDIWRDALRGQIVIVASAFVLAEVVRSCERTNLTDAEVSSIEALFQHSWIKIRDLDRRTGKLAADIGRKHGI